ncbi:retron St85 family effector protein [Lederbergia wuyishanensis]|uniref:Uncharacterized protein n=1 Tax=Lederbergia wuyishanensis TaxID=1347903 RepID=A0ABU0D0G8_9BACI|nr:retron St85 family effector protein [Lederbergia wuyishanensis]MCJ8006512.1 retron St85 family effector protein [Lederbergia wuyishanensis]MDQ0341889.1 hypothetical protein [Lederbergia wuyishanensis]
MAFKIDNFTEQIINQIYDEIFYNINQNYIDVFLCGGVSNSDKKSIRDQVRDEMKKYSNIRILYPEDMFIEMLNKDKNYDLLSLERFLADNSDIICIVCESAGSLVELGAFTNNDKTVNKVVAVIDEKRKRDKSFIMLGPIKILQKINKNNVVFYNESDIGKLENDLNEIFNLNQSKRKKIIDNRSSNNKALNTIIGMYYFIPLLLYFFKKIDSKNVVTIIKFLLARNDHGIDDFNATYKASLRLLYKDKFLIRHMAQGEINYSLSEKGYKYINDLLKNVKLANKTKLYDKIRFDIIKEVYY